MKNNRVSNDFQKQLYKKNIILASHTNHNKYCSLAAVFGQFSKLLVFKLVFRNLAQTRKKKIVKAALRKAIKPHCSSDKAEQSNCSIKYQKFSYSF